MSPPLSKSAVIVLRRHGYCLLYLSLVVTILFHEVIIDGRGFYLWDITETIIPIKDYIFGRLKSGVYPLWAPELMGGYPIYAGAEGAEFYPLNWLFLSPLATWRAVSLTIVMHVFLAGLFMYWYLYTVYRARVCSLFGAQCFMLSGFVVSRLIQLPILESAIWLPLLFLCLELAYRNNSIRYLLWYGIIIAVQFLAFSFQMTIISLFGSGLYFCYLFGVRGFKRSLKWVRTSGLALLIIMAATGLGLGVSAYKVLGLARLLPLSLRSTALDYNLATLNSLPLSQYLTLIHPTFFGASSNDTAWSELHFHEGCIYLGILPLFLGALGLRYSRHRYTCFFAGGLFVTLLIAGGQYSLLFDLLYAVPILNRLRAPGRFMLVATFLWSALAAGGFKVLTTELLPDQKRRLLRMTHGLALACLIVCVSATVFYLPEVFTKQQIPVKERLNAIDQEYIAAKIVRIITTFPRETAVQAILFLAAYGILVLRLAARISPRLFATMGLLLLVVDEFWFSAAQNPTAPESYFTTIPQTAKAITENAATTGDCPRLIAKPGSKEYLYPGWSYYGSAQYQAQEWLLYNIPLNYGITTLTGLMELSLSRWRAGMLNMPIVRLGVPYGVVGRDNQWAKDSRVLAAGVPMAFKFPFSLPRAQYVSHCTVESRTEQIIPKILELANKANHTLVLEELPREVVRLGDVDQYPLTAIAMVQDRSNERVVVTVDAPQDGYVLLRDQYYPDWVAFVNNRPARIYRADYFFRGVEVRAGPNVIQFVFKPYRFKLGVAISQFCLIALVLGVGFSWLLPRTRWSDGEQSVHDPRGLKRRRYRWVLVGALAVLAVNTGIQYVRDPERFRHHVRPLARSECLYHNFDSEQSMFYHEFSQSLGNNKR